MLKRLNPKKWFENKLQEEPKKEQIIIEDIGQTGTQIYGGYFQEEYLTDLQGSDAANIYDKMRRSDSQIKMTLASVVNTITGGVWKILPIDDSEDAKKIADFCNFIFFKDLDLTFKEKLKEILTCIPFGYSLFFRTHKIVKNHKQWGDYIGIKKLAFRSQRTIEDWVFNQQTKELESVKQAVYGDLSFYGNMSAKDLLIFSIEKEGDNYEGISMLRQCYGPWFRKNTNLKLLAAGMEKSMIPTPIGYYPQGQHTTQEYANFKNSIKSIASHQSNYIMLPKTGTEKQWEIDFAKIDIDVDKAVKAIDYEDNQIVRAFIAQFLMLGSGATGSWSLSTDQSDFFLNGIVFIADLIKDKLNKLIEEIVDFNFGPQDIYPTIEHANIRDRAGKEFAEVLGLLKSGNFITPDDILEKFIRSKYELPEMDMETQRQSLPAFGGFNGAQSGNNSPSEDSEEKEMCEQINLSETVLAESVKKDMDKYSKEFSNLQNKWLTDIGYNLIDQVINNYKSLPENNKIAAIKDISAKNVSKYKTELNNFLGEVSDSALNKVTSEFIKKAKLSEMQFAKKKVPTGKDAKKFVNMQSEILSTTQAADLEKVVALQFGSTFTSTNDPDVIRQDLISSVDKDIAKKEALSLTAISQTINATREEFFFDDSVKDEIESFTFRNDDPVSDICQSLQNQTFAASDARAWEYSPPLHHNCKSFLEPNFKDSKNNPDITGLSPKGSPSEIEKAMKQITLSNFKMPNIDKPRPGNLQSVIISKKIAKSIEEAKKIAKEFGAQNLEVDETSVSYRFRQRNPSDFVDGSFRTFKPKGKKGVALIYGKLK